MVLRNHPTQEIKDKTNAELAVIDEQLSKLRILSNFSDKMTEIRNLKKHVDGVRVEIFGDHEEEKVEPS